MNRTKLVENLQYVVLAGLIIAQCVIGSHYLLGQGIYLFCNVLSLVRCFLLKRPKADIVKDVCCTAITMGLIGIWFLK